MIHKYELNGIKIVMDVNSGSVHAVDEIMWDILDLYKKYSFDEIKDQLDAKYDQQEVHEAYEEIEKLVKNNLLFTPDMYEEKVLNEKHDYNTKALCLNIAHDCNMRCGYCFASTGDYHGGRKLMPLDIAKKAIDFLLETSGNRKNLELDFFGGEPLLNFDVIKKTVEYGRDKEKEFNKKIGFTMTTNAILLNEEMEDFINENMNNVVLSIDGRKDINDSMRKNVDGTGTFDQIINNIDRFIKKRQGKSYYVRGTFTSKNLDFSNDVLFLADKGFKEVSIEPVVTESNRTYALKEEHLSKIYEEYEKLANKIIEYRNEGRGFNFYHYMIDLDGGPCVYKRVTACGAGVEYYAITPEGDIYPCHQFVGNDKFLLGNLSSGTINKVIQEDFSKNTVYHKQNCKDCWAKFYCSGGCRANAVAFNGDLSIPYAMECNLQKKRVECAIMIKVHEAIKASSRK